MPPDLHAFLVRFAYAIEHPSEITYPEQAKLRAEFVRRVRGLKQPVLDESRVEPLEEQQA
jgi:hypothetical protein